MAKRRESPGTFPRKPSEKVIDEFIQDAATLDALRRRNSPVRWPEPRPYYRPPRFRISIHLDLKDSDSVCVVLTVCLDHDGNRVCTVLLLSSDYHKNVVV